MKKQLHSKEERYLSKWNWRNTFLEPQRSNSIGRTKRILAHKLPRLDQMWSGLVGAIVCMRKEEVRRSLFHPRLLAQRPKTRRCKQMLPKFSANLIDSWIDSCKCLIYFQMIHRKGRWLYFNSQDYQRLSKKLFWNLSLDLGLRNKFNTFSKFISNLKYLRLDKMILS